MKVSKETQNKLKFKTISMMWCITGAIFGICGGWYGVFLNAVVSTEINTANFSCQRTQLTKGDCQLVNSNLWSSQRRNIKISALEKAKIRSTSSNYGMIHQVVIVTSSGEVSLSNYPNYNYKQAQIIKSSINSFINNPRQKSLQIELGYKWFIFAGVIAIALITTAYILVMFYCFIRGVETWIFEKAVDNLTIKQQSFLKKKLIQELSLQEITNIEVEASQNSESDVTYQLSINLLSGQCIPLNLAETSPKERKQKIADSILNFIKS